MKKIGILILFGLQFNSGEAPKCSRKAPPGHKQGATPGQKKCRRRTKICRSWTQIGFQLT